MQRQIEGEERDRLDADRPVFVAEHGEIGEDDYGQRRVGVRLIQDGGTALSSVRVTVSGTYVEGIRTDADSSGAVSSMDLGSSADGTVHRLWVGVEHEYVSPVTITFRIDSTARDTDATWTRDLALNASPLPDPSPYRSRVTREVVRRPFAP
ncbi:hypothetical protein SAMN05442782_8696 [Streptomyces sp. OK228]|nr:hypothetical protein SAMN05442782_8696 [Streptomyces sp. OK228]